MKKNIFALTFLTFLLLFADNALAQSAEMRRICEEKAANVKYEFTSSYGRLKYIENKNRDFIIRKVQSREGREKYKSEGAYLYDGLAYVPFEQSARIFYGQYAPNDVACIYPIQVEFYFGIVEPTIYIARELHGKQCRKALTYRHEQTHVQIYVEALEYFYPQMKALIKEHIGETTPVYVKIDDVGNKKSELQNNFYNRIDGLIEQFNSFVEAEQDKLDNKKNYEFENRICGY